jgi:hypothetical protein
MQEQKKVALQHYEIKGTLKSKNGECAACLKYSVLIFVENNIQNATSGG